MIDVCPHGTPVTTGERCGACIVEWLRDRRLSPSYAERDEAAEYIEALEAERATLRAAILAAHPSGEDSNADPIKVLQTLAREWMEELMRGPPQTVEFVDDDGYQGALEWEDGDESVGIQSGYVLADYEAPRESAVARDVIEAARPFVEMAALYDSSISEEPAYTGEEPFAAVATNWEDADKRATVNDLLRLRDAYDAQVKP